MFEWLWKKPKRALSYEAGIAAGLSPGNTLSGVSIDEQSSLGLTAVLCAVRTISSTISWLPLELYRRNNQGKEVAREHPLYELLRYSPNPEQDHECFWESLVASALLWGNGFAEVERFENGRPAALWLLPAKYVQVCRDEQLGLYYKVQVRTGKDVILPPDLVFHLKGLGTGDEGLSPIQMCRESLALTKATEQFGSSFFGNAARPGGLLSYPGQLSDNARENVRKSWEALHRGSTNTGRVALLEDGMSFTPLTIPPEDGQFVQTRAYQLNEVARIFNLSPVFLHDLTKATWSNLETLNRQFVAMTLMPWLRKAEAQVRSKLISVDERSTYFSEFKVDALLRADTLSRYQANASAIQAGWKTRQEVRDEENLNYIKGMELPTVALNTGVVEDGTSLPANPDTDEPTL